MRKRINVKLFLLRRLLYQSFLVQQFQRQKEYDELKRIEKEEKEKLKKEEQDRLEQEKIREYQQLEEDLEKQMEEARKIAVQVRIQEELKRLKEQVWHETRTSS